MNVLAALVYLYDLAFAEFGVNYKAADGHGREVWFVLFFGGFCDRGIYRLRKGGGRGSLYRFLFGFVRGGDFVCNGFKIFGNCLVKVGRSHCRLLVIEQPLILLAADDSIPTADLVRNVLLYARIGKA